MAYVIEKRGKFMTGHSYATGIGTRYSWSRDPSEARRFADDDQSTDYFSAKTGGKIVRVENTRKELKELGKRRLKEFECGAAKAGAA